MSDLIDRQSAIDAVEHEENIIAAMDSVNDSELKRIKRAVMRILSALPSAEPERKNGKWIDKSGGIEGAWNYCSVCGEQAIDLYDFCPNCGADMREVTT